ncbi:MAG: glycosyltransferase family 2 protein [Solirubrobacteraceae bacterium]
MNAVSPTSDTGRGRPVSGPETTFPELAFVMAAKQNLFFRELVGALRTEVERLGARTSLHEGNFPPPRADLVYVLTPPHEYFSLMHGRVGPPPRALRRTVFICGEQPETHFFEQNVQLAARAGAIFDINRHAVSAFARRGIRAKHLQLGWTAEWDHLRERERDIDILFMGCASERRARELARFGALWRRRCVFVLSDNSRPNWAASESFRSGKEKWDLLGRAKILVNIHQDEEPYFEWLRIVQAISNGAVVVTEHALDFEPLVPGQHFLAGGGESLPLLSDLLLEDGDRWLKMQTAAYGFLREELTLAPAARSLLDVASAVAETEPLPASRHLFFTQRQPDAGHIAGPSETYPPPPTRASDERDSTLRRAVKDVRLELLDLRRALAQMQSLDGSGTGPPAIELVRRTTAYPAQPLVSVLMGLHNYEHSVSRALRSLLDSQEHSWEVIIVDDGSRDRSQERVHRFMDLHEDVSVTLLRHPINRGLGHARNSALGWARGEFCFVLDADNEIYPHCLRVLVAALERDDADFAYGILECFDHEGPNGLLSSFPWEPERLRAGNYIDAMALMSTAALRRVGGWSVDRRLHGWEDFDLWCQFAEHGMRGVHVPAIVARYQRSPLSMLSLTNLSVTDAFAVVIARAPELMAGVRPPA